MTEIPSDKLNLEFVLGNKVMVGTVNASREYFESGIRDMALAEEAHPQWLERLITHRVAGLNAYKELFQELGSSSNGIKVVCEVAA